jgi:hypothetical protein
VTPEGKVKRWAAEQLERLLPGCVIYRPLGGAFGKAGEPDFHVGYGGCMGVIEAKANGDDHPSDLQWKRLREYSKTGVLAMVLRGKDLQKLQFFAKLMTERAECLKHILGQHGQA